VLYICGALVLAAAGCLVAFYIFVIRPEIARQSKGEDLKAVLAAQPDFLADCEGLEGDFSYQGRMARKGESFLLQLNMPRGLLLHDPRRTGKTPVSALIVPNKDIQIVVPEVRAYIEVPPGTKDLPKEDPIQEILTTIKDQDCYVRDFGRVKIGDYDTRVFCISDRKGARRDGFVYVAPALQNLIVKIDFNDDWTKFDGPLKYVLTNVALTVDDELFHVPVTYTKVAL